MILPLIFIALVAYLWFVGYVRSSYVLKVRVDFIHMPDGLRSYYKLPSFDAMALNPRYYLLWTTPQWQKWVERNVRS